MEELWFLATAIIVGLISLKLIPAKKLRAANRKMRNVFPGMALAIMYVVIGILFIVGAYFLCEALNTGRVARDIILGVLLGLIIGFVPLVDKRNTDEDDEKK